MSDGECFSETGAASRGILRKLHLTSSARPRERADQEDQGYEVFVDRFGTRSLDIAAHHTISRADRGADKAREAGVRGLKRWTVLPPETSKSIRIASSLAGARASDAVGPAACRATARCPFAIVLLYADD